MEAFTLLKYWRGGGAALGLPPSTSDTPSSRAAQNATEEDADDDDDNHNNDDGPFFDLEFTLPDEEDAQENPNRKEEEEEEEELKFSLSPNRTDPNLSPSEDLFFKGKLVQLEPSQHNSSKPTPPQFTSSLFKSATKFRVFMLGLKKPKPTTTITDDDDKFKENKKHFTVKLKVEEVPIVSLFTSKPNKTQPQPSEDKQRFSKEVMQKYFKIVKPLYVRVSRRYTATASKPPPSPPKPPEGLAETQKLKHLGKSRSASSAAVAAAPPPALVSSKRRDDSLLQQQDGIQGAILHCKRSFNASRAESESSSQLPRSVSHPWHEIISNNEAKDKRLST